MTRIFHIAFLGIAGVALGMQISGCAQTGKNYSELASHYRTKDPVEDAKTNFRNRDYRVFSAMGVGQFYPGLEHQTGRRFEERYGVVHLPHTSDVMESKTHHEYVSAATEYARIYNRTVTALVRASGD